MRVIKLAVISAIALFAILYLMSLMIPSNVRISRAINIEGPASRVYPLVMDTSKWHQWNEMKNPQINVAILSKESNQINTRWTHNNRSINSAINIHTIGEITVVQWYFDFRLNWYPWEKFGSITFEKQFGPPMEKSLTNLKTVVTNSP
jgi:hypothetical protein